MKRIMIFICLISLSVFGLSQRTAEVVSFNQTKEGHTTIYEMKLKLSYALDQDDLITIEKTKKETENNFIAISDRTSLILRSTPDYTTGKIYASLFKSLEIETLLHINGDSVTSINVDSYLNKINR